MTTHRIELPLMALNRTDLPPVCAITGQEQGVTFRKVRFVWYPQWVALLALPALLVAAILAALLTRRAEGELPFTARGYWRWRLGQAGFSLSVVAACAALPAGLFGVLAEQKTLAWGALLIMVPLPVAAYFLLLWRRAVSVVEIRPDVVVLKIPSQRAADAWRAKVSQGVSGLMPQVARALAVEANASMPAPADARCATHPQLAAAWACGRCGSFFCEACGLRPEPGAQPLCASCVKSRAGALQGLTVRPALLERFQTAGVALGVLTMVPGCLAPFLFGAVTVNVVALVMTLRRADRWRLPLPLIGLGLNAVGLLIWWASSTPP